MKGLWKYISPFAPDQSGAGAVLYGMGGIIVVCDAGGCAGNICGFDEPRWFSQRSAVFSAGLRDMDAILGRDDRLVDKLAAVAGEIDADFAAIIGTPVPAVIATDYRGLRRLAEKRIQKPIITVETTGTEYYDKGEALAYKELLKTFAKETGKRKDNSVGIFGATPLDCVFPQDRERIKEQLLHKGWDEVHIYGEDGLELLQRACENTLNLVLSPSGLEAAVYACKMFGTPYNCIYPLQGHETKVLNDWKGKRVLVVHQQVAARQLADELAERGADVMTATWFSAPHELMKEKDVHLAEEDDFLRLIEENSFQVIFADIFLKRATGKFKGLFVDFPHFAVSGRTSL